MVKTQDDLDIDEYLEDCWREDSDDLPVVEEVPTVQIIPLPVDEVLNFYGMSPPKAIAPPQEEPAEINNWEKLTNP